MTYRPSLDEYASAAMGDAKAENLPIIAVNAAWEIARDPVELFYAIQGAVMLKDTLRGRFKSTRGKEA